MAQWMMRSCSEPARGNNVNRAMRSASAARVVSLIDASQQALAVALGMGAEPAREGGIGLISTVHFTAGGDVLASSAASDRNEGYIYLHGTIGAFPCALHLRLGLAEAIVSLELSVSQPFILGPIAWRFELLGSVTDTADNIVSATSVAAAIESGQGSPMLRDGQLGAWRFINRVGELTLPTLTAALPSLAAGSDAFVAWAVARIGSHDAPQMAEYLLGDALADSRRSV